MGCGSKGGGSGRRGGGCWRVWWWGGGRAGDCGRGSTSAMKDAASAGDCGRGSAAPVTGAASAAEAALCCGGWCSGWCGGSSGGGWCGGSGGGGCAGVHCGSLLDIFLVRPPLTTTVVARRWCAAAAREARLFLFPCSFLVFLLSQYFLLSETMRGQLVFSFCGSPRVSEQAERSRPTNGKDTCESSLSSLAARTAPTR